VQVIVKRIAVLLSAAGLLGCGKDPAEGLVGGFIDIRVSPQFYRGTAGLVANDTITVTVLDHLTRPVVGVHTSFGPVYSYATGDLAPDVTGHVQPLSSRTDSNGQVRAIWTFAKRSGYQQTSVQVEDLQRESFAAEVQPGPTRTLKLTAPAAPVVVGTVYNIPIRAEDAYGNEILLVSWQIGTIPNRRPVKWTVSDPSIGSVDSLGRATQHGAGNLIVAAEVESISAMVSIAVINAATFGSRIRK
jgi:hypothetical protein